MSERYILDGKKAVKCEDLITWAKWFETAKRQVAIETVGDVKVSTVFLSLDHSFDHGSPLLFETMVFGGPLDQEQERCSTWEQAEAIHVAMVERVKKISANAPYKNWGWINGLTDLERVVFHAERLRHDKEMADGTGEHHADHVWSGNTTEFTCSCGFAYKMDSSG